LARIYPEVDTGITVRSERLFYRWLRDGLDDGYAVLHGIELLTLEPSDTLKIGEADFLVIHKDMGLLVIEVKGGEVRRVPSKNKWLSIDHNGNKHEIPNPFHQARENMFTLVNKIKDEKVFGGEWKGELPITYGYAVAFPDCAAPDRQRLPEADARIVMDRRDGKRIAGRIDAIFEYWRHKQKGSRGFTEGEYQALLSNVLLAHYNVTRPLWTRFEEERSQFVRLTREQCRILGAIPDLKRALFKGYAGTGKTQLLMEKARRFASQGARVLVLCYNQPLEELLSLWAGSGVEHVKVSNFHGLCEEYAREAGLEYPEPSEDRPAERRQFYEVVAPEVLKGSISRVPHRFDCILVDEGQDFRYEWLDAVMRLLDPGGLNIFYIFYDEQQNIYGKELRFPFEAEPFELKINCRSTKEIRDITCKLGSVEIECFEGCLRGEKVRYHAYGRPEDQVPIIEEIVVRLTRDKKVPPSRILIVSSHKRSRSCLAEVGKVAGYPLVEFEPPGREGTIGFSSLHRAKGLESDVVIFCDVDGGEPQCSRSNQYVAVSRARHLLHVVHSQGWQRP